MLVVDGVGEAAGALDMVEQACPAMFGGRLVPSGVRSFARRSGALRKWTLKPRMPSRASALFIRLVMRDFSPTRLSCSRLFVSADTSSTRPRNTELQRWLNEHNVNYSTGFEPQMGPGSVAFLAAASDTEHRDFVTQAWAPQPLADLLTRLNGYARR